MVADAALWAIFAAAIAFIVCGCHCTRRRVPKIAEDAYQRDMDRAA